MSGTVKTKYIGAYVTEQGVIENRVESIKVPQLVPTRNKIVDELPLRV
jgi:hypothetical protein